MDSPILIIVVPVFLVIGLGFTIKRTGLVGNDFLFNLNRLVYYVALPALLFYKIGTADFGANFNPVLLGCLATSIAGMFLLSYAYGAIRGYSPAIQGAFCQGLFEEISPILALR